MRTCEALAVVADVHLGYEWARAAGGDMVPPHSLAETIEALERLIGRAPIRRLIVAGDLVESRRPCPRTARDVRALGRWLSDREVALEPLAGNHDPPRRPALPETLDVGGWCVGHGHRPLPDGPAVIGHFHPCLQAGGMRAPCFVVSERLIVLPAFSRNAAGQDVTRLGLPEPWDDQSARVVAGCGAEMLDFGTISDLRRRLG